MHATLLGKVVLAGALFIATCGTAPAQVLDNPVAIPVTVHAKFTTNGTSQTLTLKWFGETSSSGDDVTWSKTGSGPGVISNPQQINLRPGKTYDVQVSGNTSISSYVLELAGPKGWIFSISEPEGSDLIRRESYDASGTLGNPDNFKIAVRTVGNEGAVLPAGEATSVTTDRLIWSVGMGHLKNGNGAGAISFRAIDFNAITYTPADLYYTAPSTEVSVVYSSGVLRQVNAPQALANIVTVNSTTYDIEYYSWKNVTGWNGTVYTTTGSPFVTYRISKPVNLNVEIKKTVGSTYWTTRLRYVTGLTTWEMYDWTKSMDADGNSMRRVVTAVSLIGSTKTTDVIEYGRPLDSSGNYTYSSYESTPSQRARKTYTQYAWGWELTKLEEGWNGSTALRTTHFEYYTNTADGIGNYRRLKKITRPDGGWTRYTYYDEFAKIGLVKEVFEPFQDTDEGRKSIYDYQADESKDRMLPKSIETQVKDGSTYYTIGKQLIGYNTTAQSRNGEPVRVETIDNYTAAAAYERTIRTVYREDAGDAYLRGQPYSVKSPDGTQTSYAYYTTLIYEYYNGSYVWRTYYVNKAIAGTTAAPSGETYSSMSSTDGDTIETIYVIQEKSTISESWHDTAGLHTTTNNRVNTTGTTFQLMSARSNSYDDAARLTQRRILTYANGNLAATNTLYDASYVSGQLYSHTDETGNVKTYTYDRQGRVEQVTVLGFNADAGLGTPQIDDYFERRRFNGANQMIRQTKVDASGAESILGSFSYDAAGRIISKTLDCCRTVNIQYPAQDQVKTINPDAGYTLENFFKDGTVDNVTGDAAAPRYVRSRYLSEKIETWSALADFTAGSTYADGWRIERKDWLGRTVEVDEPLWDSTNGHPARRTYSSFVNGQLRSAYQMSETFNGSSWSFTTPVAATTRFEYYPLGDLKRTGLDVDANSSLDLGSDRNIRETLTKYYKDGSGYWWQSTKSYVYPTDSTAALAEERRVRVAPDANQLGKTVVFNALGGNPDTTTTPRATVTAAVNRSSGLVTETTDFSPYPTGDRVRLFKAGLLAKQTDPAGAVVSYDYDNLRRLASTTERGSVKTLYLYENGSASRVKEVKQDYGAGQLTIVDNTYSSSTGRLEHAIRKNFVVNAGQDEHSYFTYTKMDALDYQYGSGTFPVDYVYNTYGQLTELHQYRNDSGTNKTTVKTIYDPATGLLEERRHFSDATNYKASKYEYNALDQVSKRTWARSSGSVSTTHNYSVGSDTAYGLLTSIDYSDTTPDVSYTYDRLGRVKTVTDAAGTRQFKPDTSYGSLLITEEDLSTNDSGRYGALVVRYPVEDGAGSTLKGRPKGVEVGKYVSGSFTASQSAAHVYDAATGRISTITLSSGAYTPGSAFTYSYASSSNLVQAVTNGAVYKKTQAFEGWRNNRYEVKTEFTNGSSLQTKADFTVPVFTWQHQVETWQLAGTSNTDELVDHYGWPANAQVRHRFDARGQVTERDYLFVTGVENTYAFDTAGNPTNFNGTGYTVNALNQIEPSVGGTQFAYDEDGNQTEDTEWSYTFDAENRLTKMVSKTVARRLEFDYDYMHRRIEKRVYNATSGGTPTWQRRFVYHGYNVIAEVDTSANFKRSNFWGLDRQSSFSATGGLEALLLTVDWTINDARWPVYDLHSNVVGMIGSDRNWKSVYTYDAFGGATKVGSFGENSSNPFRFATKYTDDESGLVYFGHRYYNPKTGRFINRDPIGEMGGVNLYRYTNNDTINGWDYLGLYWMCIEWDDDTVFDLPGGGMEIRGGGCKRWVEIPDGDGNDGGGAGNGGGYYGGGGNTGGSPGGGPRNPEIPTTPDTPDAAKKKTCDALSDAMKSLSAWIAYKHGGPHPDYASGRRELYDVPGFLDSMGDAMRKEAFDLLSLATKHLAPIPNIFGLGDAIGAGGDVISVGNAILTGDWDASSVKGVIGLTFVGAETVDQVGVLARGSRILPTAIQGASRRFAITAIAYEGYAIVGVPAHNTLQPMMWNKDLQGRGYATRDANRFTEQATRQIEALSEAYQRVGCAELYR